MRALHAAGLRSADVAGIIGRTSGAVQQQWDRSESVATNSVIVIPRTTEQIATTLKVAGEKNHAIPATDPIELPDADLPIDPYILGYLLGDGDATGKGRVACDPQDRAWLMEEFCAAGYDAAADVDPGHFGVHGISGKWQSLRPGQE